MRSQNISAHLSLNGYVSKTKARRPLQTNPYNTQPSHGGRQPLSTADEKLWVTFNGEIFNYVELTEELTARGRQFRTRCDTETVLHAYAEYGPDGVQSLNGDFAYAIWDRSRERLVMARDRMGVRPLYYTVHDGVLVFASEVKSLFLYPGLRAELDPLGLDQCFTFWSPLAPRTAFKGVHELPPGHQLIAEHGRVKVQPYWQLRFPSRNERASASEDETGEQVEALLADATRIRMRADVPVGAYLSGGFDSSVTTALAKRHNGALRTFSLEFESPELDESSYQRTLVEALSTDHSSLRCKGADISASFEQVIRHTERPVLRSAPAALFLLSRVVRDHGFKVVLTGEGADEIFGGYDIFKEAKIRRFWSKDPSSARRASLVKRLYPYLPQLQRQPAAALRAFFHVAPDDLGNPCFSHLPR